METTIYFVRHAESVFVEGKEKSRGLTDKGYADTERVGDYLRLEDIDLFYSSPYDRAIATIAPAAKERQVHITIEEDLRERAIGDFTPLTFKEAKQRVYEELSFAFPGGESSIEAQQRAANVLQKLTKEHEGKKMVIGTHGDIMTLMLNDLDRQYGYAFWQSTSMPDIYKVIIKENARIEVIRMWEQ